MSFVRPELVSRLQTSPWLLPTRSSPTAPAAPALLATFCLGPVPLIPGLSMRCVFFASPYRCRAAVPLLRQPFRASFRAPPAQASSAAPPSGPRVLLPRGRHGRPCGGAPSGLPACAVLCLRFGLRSLSARLDQRQLQQSRRTQAQTGWFLVAVLRRPSHIHQPSAGLWRPGPGRIHRAISCPALFQQNTSPKRCLWSSHGSRPPP